MDIRWKQRFSNYRKALQALADAVRLAGERPLSALEEQGVIQAFEFTHELAWNVLKDYLEHQGVSGVVGSRGAVRAAFQNGLIDDAETAETWMTMIADRNRSSHAYDQDAAREIIARVIGQHYPAFEKMRKRFSDLAEKSEDA